MASRKRVLALFDIDGTLSPARQSASPEMMHLLEKLRKEIHIGEQNKANPRVCHACDLLSKRSVSHSKNGDQNHRVVCVCVCVVFFFFFSFVVLNLGVVGGSDLVKQQEQLRHDALQRFDYNFPENGIVAYKAGHLIHSNSLVTYLGEERYKTLVNFILHYIADLDIPVKRGTFIELRTGLMNVSPIGRNCTPAERAEYEKFDLQNHIRAKFVSALQSKFADYKVNGNADFFSSF